MWRSGYIFHLTTFNSSVLKKKEVNIHLKDHTQKQEIFVYSTKEKIWLLLILFHLFIKKRRPHVEATGFPRLTRFSSLYLSLILICSDGVPALLLQKLRGETG